MTALRRPMGLRAPWRRGQPELVLVPGGVLLAAAVGCALPGHAKLCLAACGGIALVTLLVWVARRFGAGAVIGLLLLAGVDALPGPNMETVTVVRTITLADVVFLALAAVLAGVWARHRDFARPSRHETLLRVWAIVMMAFWVVGAGRAWIVHSVPLFNGLFWGRSFFYLALFTPLFARTLSVPAVRRTALVTVAIGICVASAAQVATVASGHTFGVFVHLTRQATAEGLIRLDSGADWIIPTGIPFGLGLVLFSSIPRERLAGAVLFAFSTAAVAVELTRALYIALVISLAITTVLWIAVGDHAGRLGRRRGLAVIGVLAAMAGGLILFQPAVISGSVVNGVAVRATSVFADLGSGSTPDPDLTFRTRERADLTSFLGSSWMFGKGLLDPSYYSVAQVVGGSIMNPDVGYLSAVMTVGVTGAAVMYFPFVYLALVLVLLRLRRRTATTSWLAYGSLAWILMALIASVTVASMLNVIGAVPSAAVLGLGCIAASEARAIRGRRAAL